MLVNDGASKRAPGTGTTSKYQISDGKYDQGKQDPGRDCDHQPVPETWPRTRQSLHICRNGVMRD